MSGFDTNPFADPVDINPFQVGTGTGRPLPPRPSLLDRRRDVALSEASLANGGTALPRCGQSARGGGVGGACWGWDPRVPGAGVSLGVPAPPPRGRCDPDGAPSRPPFLPFPFGEGSHIAPCPQPHRPSPPQALGSGARRQQAAPVSLDAKTVLELSKY